MKIKAITLVIMVSLTSPAVMASGIPTVDLAAIAQTVQEGLIRAQEAQAALEQAKKEFDQNAKFAEETKKRLEGFTDFQSGFDSSSAYMKKNLSELTGNIDISGMRSKYKMQEGDREDYLLKQIKFYDEYNTMMNKRAKNLDKLQRQFKNAKTPQQKSDLTNQLLFEKLTIDSEIKQYEIAQRQFEQIRTAEEQRISGEWDEAHSYKG